MDKFPTAEAQNKEGLIDLLAAIAEADEQDEDSSSDKLPRMQIYALVEERFGNWWDEAECKGVNADQFFPSRGESTRRALGMCAACDGLEGCLITGLETNEKFGIWGGATERPRRALKRILQEGGSWDDVIAVQRQVLEENKKFATNATISAAKDKLEEIEARGKKPAA